MTPDQIRELRALERAATPGEWTWTGPHEVLGADFFDTKSEVLGEGHIVAQHFRQSNAALIVAARNALVPLLDEVERVTKERDRAREALAENALLREVLNLWVRECQVPDCKFCEAGRAALGEGEK